MSARDHDTVEQHTGQGSAGVTLPRLRPYWAELDREQPRYAALLDELDETTLALAEYLCQVAAGQSAVRKGGNPHSLEEFAMCREAGWLELRRDCDGSPYLENFHCAYQISAAGRELMAAYVEMRATGCMVSSYKEAGGLDAALMCGSMLCITEYGSRWRAVIRRDKERFSRTFFHDDHGGREAALREAQLWRDDVMRGNPRRYTVKGVYCIHWPDGTARMWRARTEVSPGKVVSKSFNVSAYGDDGAKAMAMAERQRQLAQRFDSSE